MLSADTLRAGVMVGCVCCVLATRSLLAQTDPLGVIDVYQISDGDPSTSERGRDSSGINSTMFKNESLRTVGNQQFTTFYDENGKVFVARRQLGNSVWDIARTEFTSNDIEDAHNVISFGVDGDGYMHLSWGMHTDELLYTRSRTPVTKQSADEFCRW